MKIKIRWSRVIGFALLLLILGVLFFMLRSYFLGVFLIVLVMTAAVSIALSYSVAGKCSMDIVVPVGIITEGEEADVKLVTYNESRIGLFGADIQVSINNTFLNIQSEFRVSIPLRTGSSELLLPMNIIDIGRYEISAVQMRMSDLFGLVFFIPKSKFQSGDFKRNNLQNKFDKNNVNNKENTIENIEKNKNYNGINKTITVLPKKKTSDKINVEELAAGATENDESDRRGSDSSEVSEIREYRDGDRIRDVHWKLSARTEELMVKLRTSLSGTELVVLLELVPDIEETKELFRYTYGLLDELMGGEPDIRLLCFDAAKLGFDEFKIDSNEALLAAFSEVLMRPLERRASSASDDVEVYLKNTYPYLDFYVKVNELYEFFQTKTERDTASPRRSPD